ncbi:MAG: SH3 domain-containing protein [Spirochaetales bacterium]|nr:SH3 domain-containing protein [Spirochaetales bacterium]
MRRLLLLTLLTIAVPSLFAYEAGDFVINDYRVNIRQGPGLDYPVVTQLNRGDKIIPMEKDRFESIGDWEDYWYKIQLPSKETAYVYGPFISFAFNNQIFDSSLSFHSFGDYNALGHALYEYDYQNNFKLKVFGIEKKSYTDDKADEFSELNDVIPLLKREITTGIDSKVQSYEDEQGELGLERHTPSLKLIEMESKTFVLYSVQYSKTIKLDQTQRETTSVSSEGIYIVYPDGSYDLISSELSDIKRKEYDITNEMSNSGYTALDLVTDIDRDDNPELWYWENGYETSDLYILFLSEDSVNNSGYLVDWSNY